MIFTIIYLYVAIYFGIWAFPFLSTLLLHSTSKGLSACNKRQIKCFQQKLATETSFELHYFDKLHLPNYTTLDLLKY